MRSPEPLRRSPFRALLLAAAFLTVITALAPSDRAQEQMILRKIEILGLQSLAPDQVIQSTGLRVGQTINADMIDAAADKLMKSGTFQAVSYRVRSADNDLTVIFEVREKTSAGTGEVLGEVQWTGNAVLSSQELSTAFGLRPGEPVDRTKLDAGIEAVRKAYARKGYVAAQVFETRTRDTASRRTNFVYNIREGRQYRMGAVIINGLTPQDTQVLKARWTLATGSTFDDSYLETYRSTVIRPFVTTLTQRTGVRSKFDVASRPDAQRQTVDVLITFK